MTFSYDPTKIADGGLNQIRFDLGDVLVEEPEKSAYLSDEEIIAVLASNSFKRAKYKLVTSLLFRFSYEVTMEVHDAKWELSDRIDAWKDLQKKLKSELDEEEMAGTFGFTGGKKTPPIFRIGMHDGRRRTCI